MVGSTFKDDAILEEFFQELYWICERSQWNYDGIKMIVYWRDLFKIKLQWDKIEAIVGLSIK